MRNIGIPEGIIAIGKFAFYGSSIESVELPKTLRSIEYAAFGNCANLKSIKCNNGLEEIEYAAFSGCPKLSEIRLPGSIKKLNPKAFVYDINDMAASTTSITNIYMSGYLARRLENNEGLTGKSSLIANWIIIDGKYYKNISDYTESLNTKPIEKMAAQNTQEENTAEKENEDLIRRIREKEAERDAVKGLFGGIRRNKIQKEINKLREELAKYINEM